MDALRFVTFVLWDGVLYLLGTLFLPLWDWARTENLDRVILYFLLVMELYRIVRWLGNVFYYLLALIFAVIMVAVLLATLRFGVS